MHHLTRVQSPRRRPSFEIAISTSPPPSSTHQVTPIHSPRDVIVHLSEPPGLAPIATPESTSTIANEDITPEPVDEEVHEAPVDVPNDSDSFKADRQIALPTVVYPTSPLFGHKRSISKCAIFLCVLCALFAALAIIFIIIYVVAARGLRMAQKSGQVCNSKECIDIAFRMSSYMDDMIDPCENFYQHSCKSFHAQSTSPTHTNFVYEQKENVIRSIHTLLTDKTSRNCSRSGILVQNLYDLCSNGIQRAMNAPYDLISFVGSLSCGPMLKGCENFDPDTYSWQRHSGVLDFYAGPYNLIVYSRDVDPNDKSKIILQIKPPNLAPLIDPVRSELIDLAKPTASELEPLLQLSLRQNLLNEMVMDDLLQDPRDIQSQLDEVAQLMIDLDKATTLSARVTPNTTYLTFRELFQSLPQLELQEFLNAELSKLYKWTEDSLISVQDFEYFGRLVTILATSSRRSVANYLVSVTTLNLKQYSYIQREELSWRDCVDQLTPLDLTAKLYIDSYGNEVNLDLVEDYLDSLKTSFISTHRSTPIQYLSSISRLTFFSGYPKRLLNEELVLLPFSEVTLNSSSYFNSILTVMKADRNFSLSHIGTYLDSDDSTEYPVLASTVVYNPHMSSLVVPIAFLQQPIMDPGERVPMYTVYSSLGVTVLQMISKVFWMGLDKNSKLDCFDGMYRNFLNSRNRQQDDIETQLTYTIELADAFKTALYGYTKWQSDHNRHHENSLPAFGNLDSIKSLMVSFSTLFCSNEGAEPGSFYEAMINSVAANSRQFSIQFQCSNSSAMYNRRTCI